MDVPEDKRGLVILDVFAAHRTQAVLDEFTAVGFEVEFIPGNCTGELQPLDLSVNGFFKEKCKAQFTDWYAGRVMDAMTMTWWLLPNHSALI